MPRTRVRWKVLFYLCLLAGVTYLDRICISMAAPKIQADLNLNEEQMGWVFSAFTLAYGIFEMPTGAWGDRAGTRSVLMRIVLWWSAFTMATAAAWNYVSLLVMRFLFGIGEAGAWPNAARTMSRWFPLAERGTAQGIFFMGAHLAGGITPELVRQLLTFMDWRAVFITFGFVGIAWAIAWFRWFRNEPEEHPETNREEQEWIAAGRLPNPEKHFDWGFVRRMFADRNMILLCIMYFTQAYGFYFCITWLPKYLEFERGFKGQTLGLLAGLPMLLCVLADLFGGLSVDRAVKRWGLRWGRAAICASGFVIGCVAMLIGISTPNAMLSAVCIGLAAATTAFPLGGIWSTCTQLGGRQAGLAGGLMNTAGQVGGFLCPIVIGYMRQHHKADWTISLYLIAGFFAIGALCWLLIDVKHPIEEAA